MSKEKMATKRDWQRARSADQKEQRLQSILEAGGRLIERVGYESITMSMIAEETGFTRSNIYRYFKVQEEIFLALYEVDMGIWVTQLMDAFKGTENLESDDFIKKWAEIFFGQKRLVLLSPHLTQCVEPRVAVERFLAFRKTYLRKTTRLISVLEEQIPSITREGWFDFIRVHEALIAGLVPLAQFTAEQTEVLHSAGMERLLVDIKQEYSSILTVYLEGLILLTKKEGEAQKWERRLHNISIGEND